MYFFALNSAFSPEVHIVFSRFSIDSQIYFVLWNIERIKYASVLN